MEEALPEYALSAEQCKILIAFWSREKDKIISSMMTLATYNNQFRGISWRIDLKSVSKVNAGVDEPVALFEIDTSTVSSTQKLAKFEMTTSETKNMVEVLNNIAQKFDEVIAEGC